MVQYPDMISLFILIAFSLVIAYFATQNTGVVSVTFGNYLIQGVPIYGVVIGSILLGVLVSSLISLGQSISSAFRIRGKETELKEARQTIASLKKENNELLLENNHLKEDYKSPHATEEPQKELVERPSFFNTLKHKFS